MHNGDDLTTEQIARRERILQAMRTQRRPYDSSVIRLDDHHDTVVELTRKAGCDPRGISGNRIVAVRPR
jgi:hypothetical protein